MSVSRPDSATVEHLVNMGFASNRASKAVFRTHNCGVEPAVNWLMEHAGDADLDSPLELTSSSGRLSAVDPVVGVPADITTVINPDGDHAYAEPLGVGLDCKAVLVVAANAKHSSGKMATLCAQAAVGLYKVMMANRIPWYPAFEAQGEKTVVMSASSGADLEKLADIASQGLLPTFLALDKSKAAAPSGNMSVLGIAGPAETVDKITAQLDVLQ